MLGRILGVGLAAALAGCYSVPQPMCGFACGPGDSCPAAYTCAADHVCHLDGYSGSCPAPIDAAIDGVRTFAVVSTMPADAATGVPVDQVLKAFVDRDVDGVDNSTFSLMTGATTVSATASYSLGSFVIRLAPAQQLAPNTTFTAVIAQGIREFQGTGVLEPTQWSFTTAADTVAPHLVSENPFDTEANVATTTTITMQFDEPVTGVDTTSVTVSDGVTPVVGAITALNASSYTFTPSTALAAATLYTVSLSSAIMDSAGNALTPTGFQFTTQ